MSASHAIYAGLDGKARTWHKVKLCNLKVHSPHIIYSPQRTLLIHTSLEGSKGHAAPGDRGDVGRHVLLALEAVYAGAVQSHYCWCGCKGTQCRSSSSGQ